MDLSLKTWHRYSIIDFPTVNDIVCPHITKRSWSNDLIFTMCLCLFIQCVFLSLKVIRSSKCTDKSKGTPPLFHFLFNCLFGPQGNRIISIINNRERETFPLPTPHFPRAKNLPLLFKVELFYKESI